MENVVFSMKFPAGKCFSRKILLGEGKDSASELRTGKGSGGITEGDKKRGGTNGKGGKPRSRTG
jgi:hypothetical protein